MDCLLPLGNYFTGPILAESQARELNLRTRTSLRNVKFVSFCLLTMTGLSVTCFAQPTITAQPTNQTSSLFADASFRVTAKGDAPLSYQWQLNHADLSGMTKTTLMIENVQRANAGNYRAIVTNPSGSVTSQVATKHASFVALKLLSGRGILSP